MNGFVYWMIGFSFVTSIWTAIDGIVMRRKLRRAGLIR